MRGGGPDFLCGKSPGREGLLRRRSVPDRVRSAPRGARPASRSFGMLGNSDAGLAAHRITGSAFVGELLSSRESPSSTAHTGEEFVILLSWCESQPRVTTPTRPSPFRAKCSSMSPAPSGLPLRCQRISCEVTGRGTAPAIPHATSLQGAGSRPSAIRVFGICDCGTPSGQRPPVFARSLAGTLPMVPSGTATYPPPSDQQHDDGAGQLPSP